jgi:hypothetical protein
MFWGAVLIVAGILLLLSRAGVIPGTVWDYLLPIVLIGIGANIIFKRSKRQR